MVRRTVDRCGPPASALIVGRKITGLSAISGRKNDVG